MAGLALYNFPVVLTWPVFNQHVNMAEKAVKVL